MTKTRKQIWLERVEELIFQYETDSWSGFEGTCPLCVEAKKLSVVNYCNYCVCSVEDHGDAACAHMRTYGCTGSSQHNIRLRERRLHFWREALILLKSLPSERFHKTTILSTGFPELWELDSKVYHEYRITHVLPRGAMPV